MEPFEPGIWPEEAVPDYAENCRRCELADQRTRMVWGEGNPCAPILVLLDNPGEREDREGNPYVCGTRETLQETAASAGLGREDLYVTYLLKCRPRRAYDKNLARRSCWMHLAGQIAAKSPEFIFCLGDAAVKTFFHDEDASVKRFRGEWRKALGASVLVSYHPLAVRRRPPLRPLFQADWMMLSRRYREESGNK
jgi:DNA polymerase